MFFAFVCVGLPPGYYWVILIRQWWRIKPKQKSWRLPNQVMTILCWRHSHVDAVRARSVSPVRDCMRMIGRCTTGWRPVTSFCPEAAHTTLGSFLPAVIVRQQVASIVQSLICRNAMINAAGDGFNDPLQNHFTLQSTETSILFLYSVVLLSSPAKVTQLYTSLPLYKWGGVYLFVCLSINRVKTTEPISITCFTWEWHLFPFQYVSQFKDGGYFSDAITKLVHF